MCLRPAVRRASHRSTTFAATGQRPFLDLPGHYETAKLGGWRSYVSDRKFFLAADGNEHPDHELAATVQALYAPASAGETHAQCVYPARTRWLKEQLGLAGLPTPDCAGFKQWFKDVSPDSAVMIFPAAYLNSPSSMFGHTLLRIDQAEVKSDKTSLLSYAINFGAYIEGSDNSIIYAWKGLMGGYPGLFAMVPYQEKLSEYRSLENRDLWEYRLNLTRQETARMVEHVWELKQIKFDYFFFDENCSYRLLELLQVARPGLRLTEQFPLTAIPTDTVKAVKAAGLVESIQYRPSRERELLSRAEPLDPEEQQWVLKVSADQKQLQDPAFKAQPRDRQALIIDAAYRLERYRANGRSATRRAPSAASNCCGQSTRTRRRSWISRNRACLKTVTSPAPGSSASAPVEIKPLASTACAWLITTSMTTTKAFPLARRSKSCN